MYPVLFFLFGTSIGSFVGVIVDRLYALPILSGRSKCLSCGHTLSWYELVPLVSYIRQKGRCLSCKTHIGIQYPLIEVVYGVLFVFLYNLFLDGKNLPIAAALFVFYTAFLIVSGVLVLYDLRHRVVPSSFLYAFLALSLCMMLWRVYLTQDLFEVISSFILFLPGLALYYITKKQGIGFGDVLLFAGVGMFLGAEQGIASLLISVWSAALVGICLQLLNKDRYHMKYALPFVPFIIFGMLVVLFTDISVWTIVSHFS